MQALTLRLRGVRIIAGSILVLCGAFGAEAGSAGLAAHRAIYDFNLDRTRASSSLADLNGRMVMEFSGSACGGYTWNWHFLTEIADQDGDLRSIYARTEAFEDGNGGSFKFTNEEFVDDTLTEESRGKADRTDSGIAVALTRPGEKNFVLDDSVVFPTEQIVKIIEAGRREQNFLQLDLYDGAADGETVYATTVVVGAGSGSRDVGDEVAVSEAGVAAVRHWPVTVSYFEQEEAQGEQMPLYVMSFILYENGISRRLRIDYGDFAIVGRLTGLEILPGAHCPPR